MKKKIKTAFKEQYIVKFNIRETNGFWTIGLEEDVFVPILDQNQEKNSHERASKLFLENKKALGYKEDDLKLVCVTYC